MAPSSHWSPAREHDSPHLVLDESWRGKGLLVGLGYANLQRLRDCHRFGISVVMRLKENWKPKVERAFGIADALELHGSEPTPSGNISPSSSSMLAKTPTGDATGSAEAIEDHPRGRLVLESSIQQSGFHERNATMYKHLSINLAVVLGLAACSAEDVDTTNHADQYPSYVEHVFAVSDLLAQSQGGRAFIDLQVAAYGYRVEPGVDHSMVDVMCPSGRFMNLETWMLELGFAPSSRDTGVVIYSSGASGTEVNKSVPLCDESVCTLEREANGQWSCLCSY
jgi:hypothetical protein